MYQFFAALLQPFPLLYLVTAVGLVVLWRNGAAARWRLTLVTVPFVLLGIASTPPVCSLAFGSLEWAYSSQQELPEDTEAIVVLSGSIHSRDATSFDAELGPETLLRCLRAAQLYHCGKPCLVVLSGGKVDWSVAGPTFAQAMHDFMVGQKVNQTDLLIEDESSTTYENVLNTAKLLSQRGLTKIVLVTSASQMKRAEGCFCRQGFQVTPFACDFHSRRSPWSLSDLLPNSHAAAGVQVAVHEWLGIVWYWFHGRL
jgi:uncharacterized SAM-binding protein YcdF (DUF218 family)